VTDAPNGIEDYLAIVRRRAPAMGLVAAVLVGLSVLAAWWYPATYRSSATILIEEQEIPADLVRSTVTSYADQRIESIKHQIMTRTNLWSIIERYGLYHTLRDRKPVEDVLQRMSEDIDVDVINAEVVDRRTGQSTHATIAFTLAYEGETPVLAQKVANELTSLFLAENLKSRQRHAQETTAFLKQEAETLNERIQGIQRRIATFKQRADGALPELVQLNMQLLDRAEQELGALDREQRSLQEHKTTLEGLLSTLDPSTPMVTSGGERILDSAERLKALRAQYASSKASLSSDHPDMVKMRREIAALEAETAGDVASIRTDRALAVERARLSQLRERYAEDHPDVARSRKIVETLVREGGEAEGPSDQPIGDYPENPAYINVLTQLSAVAGDLSSLEAKREELSAQVQRYAARVATTPALEREYLDLVRDRDNSVLKYHDIRSKLLEAQVSEGLEAQRKSEQFSLIDPPLLPERPVKPNRPAIVVLGLVLAMMGGVGWGAAAENLDRTVRTPRAVERITQQPPLAVIPRLPSPDDESDNRRRRMWWFAAGVAAVVAVLGAIAAWWWPLDVLWYAVRRKAGL
jgi:uncharacterized protein involved in exopolysaccharide biosynthesis